MFIIHHASSLSSLWDKLGGSDGSSTRGRRKFKSILKGYWDRFLATWSVLLHGNPIRDIFEGIRVAACGELGVGVGEEDRGSGERDVLEGFVDRIDGLVDLVVGRYGNDGDYDDGDYDDGDDDDDDDDDNYDYDSFPSADNRDRNLPKSMLKTSVKDWYGFEEEESPWLGTGAEPGPEDGAVFLGVGSLSRRSLRDVTYWMDDVYTWGDGAYGVSEDPSSSKTTRRKAQKKDATKPLFTPKSAQLEPLPKSVAKASPNTETAAAPAEASDMDHEAPPPEPESQAIVPATEPADDTKSTAESGQLDGESGMNKLVEYLKLGYGTYWSLPGSRAGTPNTEKEPPANEPEQPRSEKSGRYLIGLRGDIDARNTIVHPTKAAEREIKASLLMGPENEEAASEGGSVVLRRLTLQMDARHAQSPKLSCSARMGPEHQKDSIHSLPEPERHAELNAVVYAAQPFIYVLLFRTTSDNLTSDLLYTSLHCQLRPLRKPLVLSTNYRPQRSVEAASGSKKGNQPQIYDFVYDVDGMTTYCNIPPIPSPGSQYRSSGTPRFGTPSRSATAGWFRGDDKEQENVWSHAEALNTHMQLLNMWSDTRRSQGELERTAETNRGWWVAWARVVERDNNAARRSRNFPPDHRRNTSVVPRIAVLAEEDEEEHEEGEKDARPGSTDGEAEDRDQSSSACMAAATESPKTVTKEIFLIKKAGGVSLGSARRSESPLGISPGRIGGGWADEAVRLAQGIGIDTRKYVDDLLNLKR